MKRYLVVFVVLVTVFSLLLLRKVREDSAIKDKPSGGSGVIEGKEVDIVSRISSRILSLEADEGAEVKAGQVLVELDCREPSAILDAAKAKLASAESQAKAAQAQMEAALGSANAARATVGAAGAQRQAIATTHDVTERQVERIQRLRGEGGATESEFDRASAEANNLQQQLGALDAQVRAAKGQANAARAQAEAARAQAAAAVNAIAAAQADVRRATAMTDECVLKAPIAGYVLLRPREVGEVVLPGATIMTLVDTKTVEVDFYLPNRELAQAQQKKNVTLLADAYPDRTFRGEIVTVSQKAEFTPRNVQTREDRDRLVYRVKVVVQNQDAALRPGMPVEVVIDGTGAGASK